MVVGPARPQKMTSAFIMSPFFIVPRTMPLRVIELSPLIVIEPVSGPAALPLIGPPDVSGVLLLLKSV